MRNKLYVSNLNRRTEKEELGQLFGAYGVVCSVVLTDQILFADGTGTGVVEMESEPAAERARVGVHGQSHFGNRLSVDWATSRQCSPERSFESMNMPDEAEANELPRPLPGATEPGHANVGL
jgi:RNA recognition motif-containing protein